MNYQMSNFLYFKKTPIDWGEGLPVAAPSYFKVKKMLGDDWKLRNEIYKYIESIGHQDQNQKLHQV